MSVAYGTAGSSSGICVYDPIFNSREDSLHHALQKLKNATDSKVGHNDKLTTIKNYFSYIEKYRKDAGCKSPAKPFLTFSSR